MANGKTIGGWILAGGGGLWIAGALLFGLTLALTTDGDGPSTLGEKAFILLFFGGCVAIPGIVALVIGLVLLRRPAAGPRKCLSTAPRPRANLRL